MTFFFRGVVVATRANVYATWIDYTGGNPNIYFNSSTNGGVSFVGARKISPDADTGLSRYPQLAALGGSVYMAWQYQAPASQLWVIKIARSGDFGQTFTVSTAASDPMLATSYEYPQLAIAPACSYSNGVGTYSTLWVYLTWEQWPLAGGNSTVTFGRSFDNGTALQQIPFTWIFDTPAMQSANSANLAVVGPYFAVSPYTPQSKVYVVWVDNAGGGGNVYYAYSTNDGQTFTAPSLLATQSDPVPIPLVAAPPSDKDDLNRVDVVWWQQSGTTYNLMFRESTNGGSSFLASQTLTGAAVFNTDVPKFVALWKNLFVVWPSQSVDPAVGWDVFAIYGTGS